MQVTHEEMRELVLSAGVAAERVFTHPARHRPRVTSRSATPSARRAARAALGLPASAFVVGSFQKDGVGWGEGLEPKLDQGAGRARRACWSGCGATVPELIVLLTGPSRGYVRRELDRLGDPAPARARARSRDELARAYHALDLYLVTSRQEGGPKAVLESMAAGVPLVSTRVGQAQELARARRATAALVDVEDVDGARRVGDAGPRRRAERRGASRRGRSAEAHAHERLDPEWARLLDGFVAREP